jgi:site-specific DNA-methyltransferase (adenine-specific)
MDFKFIKGDCTILMKNLPNNSVNAIITDPPWKYLKNQKLEIDFNEEIFFGEAKRVLRNDGFIVLFGRGESFYRWNLMLVDLGFIFKEEIVWDKKYTTSPVLPLSRVHELMTIYTKNTGTINRIKLPYTQSKTDYNSIIADVKRLKTALKNEKSFNSIIDYLESGKRNDFGNDYTPKTSKYNTTIQNATTNRGDRATWSMVSIKEGMKPKTIIEAKREHYKAIHPTQKPIELMEILIQLVTNKNELIVDPFAGSCSTGIACKLQNRNFIGYEINEEYYNSAIERINQNGFGKADAGVEKINYGQTELNFD